MKKRHSKLSHSAISPSSKDGGFFYAEDIHTPQIVITGGPGCGKSTAVARQMALHGNILTVTEAATQVLRGGFPAITPERPWTQTWQNALQHAIAGHQIGLELLAQEDAQRRQKQSILQDRGLLDGAAYLEGGIAQLEDYLGMDKEQALGRYHTVIYLGSLARPYETLSNPHRFEEKARAQALAATVLEAWQDHPNLIEIHNRDNRTEEIDQAVINTLMNIERVSNV